MLNAHQNEFQVISSQILSPKFCWQALHSGSFQKSIDLILITFVVKLFSFAHLSRLFKEDLVPITTSSRSLGFADT